MKKYLLVISLALITLLAVGAVSAGDVNATDDLIVATASLDDEQAVFGEMDDINDESTAGMLQAVSNQGILSEDDKAPAVDVDDVNLTEGEKVSIPFHVNNSDDALVSGGVNVTISGENTTISKYIELNNVTGQTNFTLLDFMEIINANGGNFSEFYDIIRSSVNSTNLNFSDILSGLNDINAGSSINISNFVDGYDYVVNGTQIDVEKLREGIMEIINGTDINILDVIGGLGEIMGGIHIDFSKIPDVTRIFMALLSGFDIDEAKLFNSIIDSISVNKAEFISGLTLLLKEYNVGHSSGSIYDFLSSLGLKIPLTIKVEIAAMILKKDLSMSQVFRVAKEILDYNHVTAKTVFEKMISSKVVSFDILDIVDAMRNPSSSSSLKAFGKIIGSLSFDTTKIINSLVNTINGATYNTSKVANELACVTGIDSSKLLKIFEGVSYIYHGVKLNPSNVLFGLRDVFIGFSMGNYDIFENVKGAVSFNSELFLNDFDKILAEFNLTRGNVSNGVHQLFSKLNLTVPDALDANLLDSLSGDKVNFTKFGNAFLEIMSYNNLTSISSDVFLKLNNGSAFDISKIISKISFKDLNISKAVNGIAKIMHYIVIDYDKIYALSDDIKNFTYNKTLVASGIARMFEGAQVNLSSLLIGFNIIFNEVDYDKAKVIEILETIRSDVDINNSRVSEGFDKILNAFGFNNPVIVNGLAKIVSSFSFNRSMVYTGFEKMAGAFSFNNSLIGSGIYKLADGLGVNTSSAIMQFFNKFGYVAVFNEVLVPGTYNVSVEYAGSASPIKDTSKLTVLPKLNTPIKFDVVVDEHHVYMTGSVDPDAKGFVLLEIGDYDVYTLVVDGKVAFDEVFEPGEYSVSAVYLGDFKFNQNSTAVPFIVKSKTNVSASNVSVVYTKTKNIVVTLVDENGNPVEGKKITVKLDGVSYSGKTNSKGQISVAVPTNLKPTTYTAKITFAGDSRYVKSTGSVKVVVSKATPKLTAKAKTFKLSDKAKKYTVTLKNHKGKVMKSTKVTIKVNKKTYTATTNSKGVATFKLTKLTKKGTFKATVTYSGNTYYKKVSKNVNIKVK